MSYLRGDPYIFSSGGLNEEILNIWTEQPQQAPDGRFRSKVYLEMGTFDELVVMRMAQLVEEGKVQATITRAKKKWKGNGGCGALSAGYLFGKKAK